MSIVICTRGRPLPVRDVVRDVLAQAPADAEVVVVDQSEPSARARTAAWLERWGDARVRHVPAPPLGLPAARNVGVEQTRAPLVLFLDDDVRLRPGCIAGHVAAYDDPWVGGAVGRIEERTVIANAPPGTNRIGVGGRVRTRLDGTSAVDVATLKGASMSFRRVALHAVGPSDPGYGGTAILEDADWSTRVRRAGWRLRFLPGAGVVHLSIPAGGCRPADAHVFEEARFRNTGRFVRRHRPWSAPLVAGTFTLIAARRAVGWREPRAVTRLLTALREGWRGGRERDDQLAASDFGSGSA